MSLQHCIANFLFSYRNMPHTMTKKTPAELFLRRQVHTRLSLVKSEVSPSVQPGSFPDQSGKKIKLRFFSVAQAVRVKNYRGGGKWLDGVITDVLGPVTYMVNVNGTCVKRHVNQMLDEKRKNVDPDRTVRNTEGDLDYPIDSGDDVQDTDTVTVVCEQTQEHSQSSEETNRALANPSSSGCIERPKRNVCPPQRLVL